MTLTDLEEIEVRAELRELKEARMWRLETPPLPNEASRRKRDEWLRRTDEEIARLERLLAE